MTPHTLADPVLEIDHTGTQVTVCNWSTLADLHRLSDIIQQYDLKILAVDGTAADAGTGKDRPSARLSTAAPPPLIEELRRTGFTVHRRAVKTG